MSISDNGDGFSQKDIINLGNIGESDKKSTFDKIKRKNGDFYAGNKGLGILSSFSLSDIIEITTNNENHSYIINWERSQGYFEYTEINLSPKTGTRLLIKEINPQDMKVLIDEEEFSKMRHAIISHFTNNNKIKIKLYIDNVESSNLSCCNINELDDLFIYKVDFMYNSKKNTLELSFLKANPPLKKGCSEINTDKLYKKLTIPLLNDLDINNLLKETYYLTKTYIPNNTNFKYLDSNLEDFNGSLFITEGAPPKTFKENFYNFQYGVRIFVNKFAMYSYLDQDNDWLGFGPLSQRIKSTTLKPHNVLGYINFDNFNEKNSSLKITNERSNFYQNASFKKFIEILKDIIVKIIFEIDVAYRNNNIKYPENVVVSSTSISNPSSDKTSELGPDKTSEPGPDKTSELGPDKTSEPGPDKTSELGPDKTSELGPDKISEPDSDKISEPDSDKTSELGPDKISEPDSDKTSELGPDKTSEPDTKVTMKKHTTKFFTKSTVLKSPLPVSIPFNDLINQLKTLNYYEYYLLYNIAFRALIEDISKRYLAFRNISINQDFALNVKNMCNDMLQLLKDPNKLKNKSEIERLFGGFKALKNYLEATASEFYYNNNPGIRSSQLNSITHNPRWLAEKDAEYIANDIIIPLFVLSDKIQTNLNK